MSRLYGRAYDVFETSNYINSFSIPKYKTNNKKIVLDELIDSSGVLDFYMPSEAIDYIVNYPIHIVRSPFIPRSVSEFATEQNPNSVIYFKGFNFKEEHKRELNFFLGAVISMIHPDKLPNNFDLPCEYGDIISLLSEYLFLKENNKEDEFLLKHLNALINNGEKYIYNYNNYQKYLEINKENELHFMNEKEIKKMNYYNNKMEKDFLNETLTMLVGLSSIDGILQITDKLKNKDEYRELINILYNNPTNNRQEILNDYGIESYGYKRLRKEFDKWRVE